MEKMRYLIKNTGFLLIGNFSSKILVFLLVPLYTSVLTTEEYGMYDILYTTIQLLLPVLTLNISDSLLRFSINESETTQKKCFQAGLKYVLISIAAFFAGIAMIRAFNKGNVLAGYELHFVLLYISYVLNTCCNQFCRGLEDVKGISIAGVAGTLLMLTLNIVFLLVLKMRLVGYFWANTISLLGQAMVLVVRNRMWKFCRGRLLFRRNDLEREMLKYCLPLILTTLSWYINSALDKYAIVLICGMAANGLYSVAHKIPSILNAVQTVFIQAWQLSAIREFHTENGKAFYSEIYCLSHTALIILCSGVIMMTRVLSGILFVKDFYVAWEFVPLLTVYLVFNTLSGVIGGVFSAVKDTKAFAFSAIAGMTSNLVANFPFTWFWGAQGAAVATLLSSVVIWLMRMKQSQKYIHWNVPLKRHVFEYGVLIVQAMCMIMLKENGIMMYILQIGCLFVLTVCNYRDLAKVTKRILRRQK